MSFDQPELTVLGHHPLGARTRYLFVSLCALPLLMLVPTEARESKREAWKRDFQSLRGLP